MTEVIYRPKRATAVQLIGKPSVDENYTDPDYENASVYYDSRRHFLMLLGINTAVTISIVMSFAAGLRMWNIDTMRKGMDVGPNIYVLIMFGFSFLCVIFMILINWQVKFMT